MNPPSLRETMRAWAPWALLALPLGILATTVWAVVVNAVPTPYQDQWATVPLWRALSEGAAAPADFFAQHNEHRIVFPRLVFMADFAWFHGRNVLNLAAIAAIQLAAAALYVLACRPRRTHLPTLLAAATAASLMFSLLQWENLFWGFQVQFVGVFAAGGWGIYLFCQALADPGRIRWPRMAGALVLLALATFTLANGLLAGCAMILAALATRGPARSLVPVIVATAGLLAAYCVGYHPIAGHSPAALALEQPARYLAYVLIYLGSPWRAGSLGLALAAGLAGAIATAAMAVLVVRDGGKDPRRTAMFGIVLFIGMTAGVTALGRLSFGIEQALSSRYVTPANHFWAAHAVFWALTAQAHAKVWLTRGVTLAILAAGLFLVPFQRHGQIQLAATQEHILAGSAALLAGASDREAIRALYPDPSVPLAMTPYLRAQRLSLFAGPPHDSVGGPFVRRPAVGQCQGGLQNLAPAPDAPGVWRVRGWGWDLEAGQRIDRVTLVDQAGTVIGLGLGGARTDRAHPRRSGWIGVLTSGRGHTATAYGMLKDGRACELGRAPLPLT